jgi:DNA modification methylase
MIIEKKKISDLIPAPYNPRQSTAKQEKHLKESLEKFGLVEPIIFNKQTGYIVGGHFRVRELKKLGIKEIECVIVDLNEVDEKELNIRLNANTGGWDWDTLANDWDVVDLEAWGLDIPQFDTVEELEASEDDYEVAEGGIETDIVIGDLFEIGEHRLLCGDSTDSDAVARLMNGEKADMVFTDPPYRVSFQGQRISNTTKDGVVIHGHKGANTKHNEIENDSLSEDDFKNFMSGVLSNLFIFNKGAWYICFAYSELHLLLNSLVDAGYKWKNIIIWMKNQAALSNMDYKSRYEPIIYGQPGSCFYGERYKQEDIWEFQRTLKNDLHPTMKPIPLIENALKNSSKVGMSVLDLFLGSGSTMVAAHQLKRKCYGLELEPKYCQVIIDRMRKLDSSLIIKRNGVELKTS